MSLATRESVLFDESKLRQNRFQNKALNLI